MVGGHGGWTWCADGTSVDRLTDYPEAMSIWGVTVEPWLKRECANYRLLVTKHKGHAQKMVADKKCHVADIYLIISGDGMLHEVVNGLADRVDRIPEEVHKLFSKIIFALIPSGTSNGLSSSLTSPHPTEASSLISQGTPHHVDLLHIHHPHSNTHLWDFHAISWGFPADCDAWMEHHRWIPRTLRTYAAVLLGVAKGRAYQGELSFLPHHHHHPSEPYHYTSLTELTNDPDRKGWKQLTGRFMMVTAINVPRGSSDMVFAPGARFDEGAVDVMVVDGNCGRWELVSIFLALESGAHVKMKSVKMLKAREFVLNPVKGSHLDASGEEMKYEPIHVKVIQGGGLFMY